MQIRVNLKPNPGACIYVYAWSNNTPDWGYKFMHTKQLDSLSYHPIPKSGEDDLYVDFKSEVPLNEWVEKVRTSEFNNHKNYRFLTHNCAFATNFALEAAGIKLFTDKPDIFFNRPYKLSPIRFPLGTLTPYDLFDAAKTHKLNQLKTSNIELQYRLIELNVKFWCSLHPSTQEEKLVIKISNEIDKRHSRHPEHIEAQIDALLKTLQLVKHLPTDQEYDAYLKSSDPFKKRIPTKAGQQRHWLILLHLLSAGLLVGAVFDAIANHFEMPYTLTPKMDLGLFCLSAFAFFKLPNKIKPLMYQQGSIIEPTELSEDMKALADLQRKKPHLT